MDGLAADEKYMQLGPRVLGAASLEVVTCQALPARMRPVTRELLRFEVDPMERGKGYGSALLKMVCAEADKHRIVLLLTVENQVRTADLLRLYSRFGFVTLPEKGRTKLMARPING